MVKKKAPKEISKGVFMEKYKEKDEQTKKNFYIIKIELKIFNVMDFQVDFTGSKNIEVEGKVGLIIKTHIEPFVNTIVAKLILKKSWNLKTKFKFSLNLPDLQTQRKFLLPEFSKLKKKIEETKKLSHVDFENLPQADLLNFLKSEKIDNFIDHDFLPNLNSLGYKSEKEVIENYDCIIQWRRSKEILFENEKENYEIMPYIINEIKTDDVLQGKLGNCWLLSALSCLSENPKLIKRLIRTKIQNKEGMYRVKICKMGDWQFVVLDDFFPCFPLGEQIFSKNKMKEIWVMLLEKAYAKLYGNYKNLETGDCKHSLIDLTGCPTMAYKFSEKETKNKIKNGELWEKIKESYLNKFLIAAGTKELPPENSITGIVKEHAYSIVRVIEEKNVKLLNLRNPWGIFEFTGDWSKDSPLWTKELKEKIKPDLEIESSFWISYKDFLLNFETLNICYTKCWQELKIKGKFVNTIDEENENIKHFCSRWFYKIKVTKKTKAIFGIHQEDERFSGVKELRPYLDIGLSIITYKDGIYKTIFFTDTKFEREIFLECELEKGDYFVVPRSIGICLKFKRELNKIKDFNFGNFLVLSFFKDLFNKYDILNNDFMNFKEMKSLFSTINRDLEKSQFLEIVKKYNIQNVKTKEMDCLTEKGFLNLFEDLLKKMSKSEILEMTDKLGYTKDLFSKRSRVFTLTIHSEELIKLSVENGLKENIDFVANKLLIRKFGENIDEKKNEKNKDEEKIEKKNDVDVYFYFNENIHSYSYGVYNRLDRAIEAKLDLSESKNLLFNLDQAIVTKIVEPRSMEFMIHAEIGEEEEEYYRKASMEWK